MASLGGLFANPTSSPWTEAAGVVALATITAVVTMGTATATANRKLTILETGTDSGIRVEASAVGDNAFDSLVTADATERFSISVGGVLSWSAGAGALDTTLERDSANILALGSSDSLVLVNAGLITWRSGGGPGQGDIGLGRQSAGYLFLGEGGGLGSSPGGFLPALDNRGQLGTSLLAGSAFRWAAITAVSYRWGAASAVEDVTITRPFASSTLWLSAPATATTPTGFSATPGAHTNLTASVESSDVAWDLNRTVEWATGALADQRAFRILAPTYGFVGASIITTASTFYVSGAPAAGANATLTNSYAILADAGVVRIDGDSAARFVGLLVGPTSITTGRWIDVTQPVNTSGSPNILRLAGGAHTTLDASAEASDIVFALNRTVQYATGALVTQRAIRIEAPTYSFVGASTLTTASTLYIDDSPDAGANATITNSYAIWVDFGTCRIDGDTANNKGCALLIGADDIPTTSLRWVQIIQPGLATPSQEPNALVVEGGTHTSVPAGVEAVDIYFDLSRTVQWATGALATQRAVQIDAPTYGFVGASTLSTAATLYLQGAPVAGTNATITSRLSLWCDGATSSVSFFSASPSLGAGLGVMFVGDANTNPSANPTAGGILYSNAGAGTWRGSGGTVTAFGPAGPHCGECGYDSWTVAALNQKWKSWHFECGHCGAKYAGGPRNVLAELSPQQEREKLRADMGWEDVARVMGIATRIAA